MNPDGAAAHVEAVDRGRPAWDRAYDYAPRDLRTFHLTRRLAALGIERRGYRDTFGTDPIVDFPREFTALRAEGLVTVTPDAIRPTPLGMFDAESIAGLLAWRRFERDGLARNDNGRGHM